MQTLASLRSSICTLDAPSRTMFETFYDGAMKATPIESDVNIVRVNDLK